MKSFECWKCNAYVKHGMGVNLGELIPDHKYGFDVRVCWGCWNNSNSNLFEWSEEE